MMTLDDFREHVDLYSADLSRWPQDKVKPALALVKADAAAKKYFDEALALDDRLRGYAPKAPPLGALEERILKDIRRTPQRKPATRPAEVHVTPTWLFAPGGGLLAAAILGFIIGLTPPQAPGDTLLDPVYYAQDQIIGDADADTGGIF
jgi:hypothetical protein